MAWLERWRSAADHPWPLLTKERPGVVSGVALLAVVALSAAASGQPPTFVYAGPSGVVFTVTDDGLSTISVGGKQVAGGGARLLDLRQSFTSSASAFAIPAPREKRLTRRSDTEVEVEHEQGDVRVRWRYRFADEDVTIAARVENNHVSEALKVAAFGLPTFSFGRSPDGQLFTHSPGYIEPNGGLGRFYWPGYWSRLGGAWQADDAFGYGLTPLGLGLSPHLFLGGSFGAPARQQGGAWRNQPLYLVPSPVPPGGARTYACALRVSPQRAFRHLLAPYKAYFDATFGRCRYRSDMRPVVMYSSGDAYHASPENPFGFNGLARRVDLPEGAKAFADMVIGGMKAARCQGFVAWALSGWDPRGAMYRTDFDVFPAAIEANLSSLRERFEEAGLRLGLATRPGEVTYRGGRTWDGTIRLSPDDPWHLEHQWRRFRRMIDAGFTLFYLDTFGHSLDDVKTARYLRERMGPNIQTYSEYHTDVSLLYSGAYKEVGYDKAAGRFHADQATWETFRWLVPEAQAMVVSRVNDADVPGGATAVSKFLLEQHMSPTIADYLVGSQAKALRGLVDATVDERGQWRVP